MEHLCNKCGAAVEDGVPFCPNCNAPQIRVSGLADRPATPPLEPGTPGELQPPARPMSPQAELVPQQIRWSEAMPGAALAGFLLALSLVIPFASPFLLMIAAGGLAAVFYAHRSGARLTGGSGARVGAAGGVLGFVVLSVLLALQVAVSGGRALQLLRSAIEEQLARNPDPRAQQVMDQLTTPGGLAVVVVFGLILFLIAVVVCSAIGGAVAGSLMRRKDK